VGAAINSRGLAYLNYESVGIISNKTYYMFLFSF